MSGRSVTSTVDEDYAPRCGPNRRLRFRLLRSGNSLALTGVHAGCAWPLGISRGPTLGGCRKTVAVEGLKSAVSIETRRNAGRAESVVAQG